MGIPSGADIGYEIAKEPFVILFDIDAALFLGSAQGVGDALSTVLRYIRDQIWENEFFPTYVKMLRFPLKLTLAKCLHKAAAALERVPSRWVNVP